VISRTTVWIDKERGRWVQVMPTGNIAGDLQPRLFFSSTAIPPPPSNPSGGERRSLLATTLTDNSLTLTSGNNRPDRTDNSRETSLEMLPKNKKFWQRNNSYHRPLCTYNPVILFLLNKLFCSVSLFKQLISRIQILSTNILVMLNSVAVLIHY
jgi:hypothetical protein